MNLLKLTFLPALLLFASTTYGDTITIGISHNNIGLPTTTDYATVTIEDSDLHVLNGIDFTVELNTSFFDPTLVASNLGMQDFFFNSSLSIAESEIIQHNPSDPADAWSLELNKNAGGSFDKFGFQLKGNGNSRTTKLEFTIDKPGDSIYDYILNNDAGFSFAMHIAGFPTINSADSGKFAAPSPIPVPAAFWLFGTALIGFIGFSRRTSI